MKHLLLAALVSGALSMGIASAQDAHVVVEEPWARASMGSGRPGAAYMTLRNVSDETVALVGMETPIATMVEVHRTDTDASGVSRMSAAGDLDLGPGDTVALEPGGLHAMLMRLQGPMTEGETFPLTLLFSDGDRLTVDVPILSLRARGPEG
jgi:copper(I)-binding protein